MKKETAKNKKNLNSLTEDSLHKFASFMIDSLSKQLKAELDPVKKSIEELKDKLELNDGHIVRLENEVQENSRHIVRLEHEQDLKFGLLLDGQGFTRQELNLQSETINDHEIRIGKLEMV
jgi:hypothetical protein